MMENKEQLEEGTKILIGREKAKAEVFSLGTNPDLIKALMLDGAHEGSVMHVVLKQVQLDN
ncbi:hypothetical protein SEA_WOFFORD_112 [Streptomyces phage Wofford]|uniref:Uncharacterized protein n=1 Tax=Streptomyces phage Wofford TaxID=2283267 RepID=A0A345M9W6_9CAUD|nr:hypothetical protein HWB78_gp168 [Streptomyces phage Wollford]AXH67287.1 hypothetical protein SEA_WOFFORD_112 [Streptomyces phage Wollford]